MIDYIKREEAKKFFNLNFGGVSHAIIAARLLDEIPAADVAPVVHGRWEKTREWATKAKYRCSVCGREIMSAVKVNIEKYPYCHCGAKMDGGDGNSAMA